MIFLVVSWFLVGFLSLLFSWVFDMRGKEYDPYYFEEDGTIAVSFVIVIFGYISPILCCIAYISENYEKPFTKLIYKLANIGIKKEDENKEGEE